MVRTVRMPVIFDTPEVEDRGYRFFFVGNAMTLVDCFNQNIINPYYWAFPAGLFVKVLRVLKTVPRVLLFSKYWMVIY